MKYVLIILTLVSLAACGDKDNSLDGANNNAYGNNQNQVVGFSFASQAQAMLMNLEGLQKVQRLEVEKRARHIRRDLVKPGRSNSKTERELEKLNRSLGQVLSQILGFTRQNTQIQDQIAQFENGSICDQAQVTFVDRTGHFRSGRFNESSGQCRRVLEQRRVQIQNLRIRQESNARYYRHIQAMMINMRKSSAEYLEALRYVDNGGHPDDIDLDIKRMNFYRNQNDFEFNVR